MASSGGLEGHIDWYGGELRAVLDSQGGEVGKFQESEAVRVVNMARTLCSGPPHGYYQGTVYPSAPGSPPGVRTGRGIGSIGWEWDGGSNSYVVGSNVNYMGILETRGNAPYPWLRPSLERCGYSVR